MRGLGEEGSQGAEGLGDGDQGRARLVVRPVPSPLLPLRFVAISDLYEPIDDGSESQVSSLSQPWFLAAFPGPLLNSP